MADAIVSVVAERIIGLIEEQARYHVNLVRGAEKEVRSLADELNTVKTVLDDAENRRFKEKSVRDWLVRLEQSSYEMEDVLDEWNYAILKLQMEKDHQSAAAVAPSKQKVWSFIPSSSCLCFKKVSVRHHIAKKILDVKAQLDEILREKDRYSFVISQPTADNSHQSWRIQSTSSIDLAKVHGRDSDRDILISKLMANGGSQEELGIRILSIVGVGGLGKTTLAQLVYNDSQVSKFFDLRMWVCVSDPFDLAAIAKGILESIVKGSSPTTTQLDVLLQKVKESISGKRFLLVLDDVWTEDSNKWEPLENTLRCGGAGSKVLVTTRNGMVAKIMGTMDDDIHRPGELSHVDCWLVLSRIALSGRKNVDFEDIGKKIAEKCHGLPLAAKTLGSLLRFKNTLEEWEKVLNSEIWQLEKAEVELFPHLLLSYNDLSPTLKRCFSYCAVLPKDSMIDVEKLIRLWMALGYLGSNGDLEGRGQEYFDILAMHSLFQDFKKDDLDGKIISCKMHDIVHDFVQFIRKSGRLEAARMNRTTCQVCDHSLLDSTHVNEFCSLFWYKESPPNICQYLTHLRALSLNVHGLQCLPQGVGNLIHLRWLSLFSITKLSSEDLKIIFQLYNLQTLALEYCNLEEIPSEIGNLIHLRHLVLSQNESLKCVPREIGNLVHLKHLNLINNESLKELPREIGHLVQLRDLELSMNGSLKELPREIGNLVQLRYLDLSDNESLKEVPREIGNLVQLRQLDLSGNESLKELPMEIWNLVQLRLLDLSGNESLKELPREIGNLVHLRHLDLSFNESLKELPESIGGFHEIQTLDVSSCKRLNRIPEGIAQLTSLQRLGEFHGGSGWSKLGLLNKLNHLSGVLRLCIRIAGNGLEEVVEDARKAELRNKIHIEKLEIIIEDEVDEDEESLLPSRMDLINALEPHPRLPELLIRGYKGSKLPLDWMVSPLNQVRKVDIRHCNHLTSLPPFGKLPFLEELRFERMEGLQYVGPQFLGIEPSSETVGFPTLKSLTFWVCPNWKEWEDIRAEEQVQSIMPCLSYLAIKNCNGLTALPHRLLRKAASLQVLNLLDSTKLKERYADEEGSDWKSISHNNPTLMIRF